MEILGVDINFGRFIKSLSDGAIGRIDADKRKAIKVKVKDLSTLASQKAGHLMATAGITRATAYEIRACHDGWMIAERGTGLPVRVYPKKADAVREGKLLAADRGLKLFVMTKSGKVTTF